MTVSAYAGRLSIHVERTASIALCENSWPHQDGSIGQLVACLSTPARAAAAAIPAALRIVGQGIVPWWIAQPAGWRGEVLLGQQHHVRGRCTIFVADAQEAVRMTGNGDSTPLRRTADSDGFELDFAPCETITVRWR
jgi:hypothetical protein